jgi:hypothetical protein
MFVYSGLALSRDAAGLSKHCPTLGRMACFVAVWHEKQLAARWNYAG